MLTVRLTATGFQTIVPQETAVRALRGVNAFQDHVQSQNVLMVNMQELCSKATKSQAHAVHFISVWKMVGKLFRV